MWLLIALLVLTYQLSLLVPWHQITSRQSSTKKPETIEARQRRDFISAQDRAKNEWILWIIYTLVKYGYSFYNSRTPVLVLAKGTFPAPMEYLLSLPSARGEGAVAVGITFMAIESVVTRSIAMVRGQVAK